MHDIEPFYGWLDIYENSNDENSPFYTATRNEFEYDKLVYNYYIHTLWDTFGSETLYLKILYIDYDTSACIIEFIGEWNDALYNDIMTLKREVLDILIKNGITKFILITENVLHFHYSDDSYYEEWFDDIDGGWIVIINMSLVNCKEMNKARLQSYMLYGEMLANIEWRKLHPTHLVEYIEGRLKHLLLL